MERKDNLAQNNCYLAHSMEAVPWDEAGSRLWYERKALATGRIYPGQKVPTCTTVEDPLRPGTYTKRIGAVYWGAAGRFVIPYRRATDDDKALLAGAALDILQDLRKQRSITKRVTGAWLENGIHFRIVVARHVDSAAPSGVGLGRIVDAHIDLISALEHIVEGKDLTALTGIIEIICDSEKHNRSGQQTYVRKLGTFEAGYLPEKYWGQGLALLEQPSWGVRQTRLSRSGDPQTIGDVELWHSIPFPSKRTYRDSNNLTPLRKIVAPSDYKALKTFQDIRFITSRSARFQTMLTRIGQEEMTFLGDYPELLRMLDEAAGQGWDVSDEERDNIYSGIRHAVDAYLDLEREQQKQFDERDELLSEWFPDWSSPLVKGISELYKGGELYWEFDCALCKLHWTIPARRIVPALDELRARNAGIPKVSVSFVELARTVKQLDA